LEDLDYRSSPLIGLYAGHGVEVVDPRIVTLCGPGVSGKMFPGHLQKQNDEVLPIKRTVILVGPLTEIRAYVLTEDVANDLLLFGTHGACGEVYPVAVGVQ